MNKGVLYSNGVVASLTQNLLTKEFLNRLSECSSIENLKSLLEETSFSLSEDDQTINEKMQIELDKLVEFVKTESPNDKFTQFFLLPFDYENLQTICKCLVCNLDFNKYLQTEGIFTNDQIKNNVTSKTYKNFNNTFIEKSLKEFDKLFQEKTLNGWEIESIFKKNMYENLLKISSNSILNEIVNCQITIENISVSMRAKTQFELESQIINLGYLDKKKLLLIFNKDKSVLNVITNQYIEPFVKLALHGKTNENIVKFEKLRQSFIVKSLSKNKDNIQTFAPFAYYCYKKLSDIKNIRLAYSYAENGLNEEIKKRLIAPWKTALQL